MNHNTAINSLQMIVLARCKKNKQSRDALYGTPKWPILNIE